MPGRLCYNEQRASSDEVLETQEGEQLYLLCRVPVSVMVAFGRSRQFLRRLDVVSFSSLGDSGGSDCAVQ